MVRCFIVFSVLFWASAASAQTPGSPAAVKKAKGHYRSAETHYEVGEFRKAITEYKEAYRLSQAPALLFNIAQAYRLAGNADQALYFYRGYLRQVPGAPNRADVEELVKSMEARVTSDRQRDQEMQALAERRRQAELRELEASRKNKRGQRGLRLTGIVTGAVGLAMIGTSGIFALSARSDWRDINELSESEGRWSPAFQDRYNAAESKETLSTVFLVTGSAAVVAGGIVYWLGRDRSGPERQVVLAPGIGSLNVVGRF